LQVLSRPRRAGDEILPALHSTDEALRLVRLLSNKRGVAFLPADINCAGRSNFQGVGGHRQWNDFYLAGLAEKNGLKLATFDEAIARTFPSSVQLIP
jgi:predicted nucleic acid-binding protein